MEPFSFILLELAFIIGMAAVGRGLALRFSEGSSPSTQELIGPIQSLFAPVFFVLMGMQVNLETFLQGDTLWLAAAFTTVAMLGKLLSGLPSGKGIDRLSLASV